VEQTSIGDAPQQERWDDILEGPVFSDSLEYIEAITVGRRYYGKRSFTAFRQQNQRARFGPVERSCSLCGASYSPRLYRPDEAYTAMVAAGLTADVIERIPRGRRGGRRTPEADALYESAASVVGSLVLDGFTQRTVAGVASLSRSMTTRMVEDMGWRRLPRAAHRLLDGQRDDHWFELHLRHVHPEAIAGYERRQRTGFVWLPEDVLLLHPTQTVEIPGSFFLNDEFVPAESLREFRARHSDLPPRKLQDYDPTPAYKFSLKLGDSSPKTGAARPAEVQGEGRFPPPALAPPISTKEHDMSAAAANAIVEKLERIVRLEQMRAETMDHIRVTVDEIAARLPEGERIAEDELP
jgi:hypothetical protein